MAEMGATTGEVNGSAAGDPQRTSIWPHVEERVVDLITAHRSTIVFADSRRLAERLTARLNEIWVEQTGEAFETGAAPAASMGQAGSTGGAPPVLARAHHGSVSKEQRALIEEDLKAGRLRRWSRPAASSSASTWGGGPGDPGRVAAEVASGLQRVGRAGHQVGAVSRGRGAAQVPRRPRADRGGGRADARRAIESLRCRATPSTCWRSSSWR